MRRLTAVWAPKWRLRRLDVARAGDVTDKESKRAPMRGVDGVFHIAGWYKVGQRDKREGARVNIDGTRNVLELMLELAIPKGVYTSTLGVNGDTGGQLATEAYPLARRQLSEYTRTKTEAHRLALQAIAQGLPLVVVMPGLIYGPADTSDVRATLLQYLDRKLPMIPKRTAFAWAHVDDIAAAHILAMDKGTPGETYIIGGPVHTMVEAMRGRSGVHRDQGPAGGAAGAVRGDGRGRERGREGPSATSELHRRGPPRHRGRHVHRRQRQGAARTRI